jgi:eukaryotic-like serine/threonine-protein kinase
MTAERYERHDRIAIGGMGEVWRAEDRLLGREVAVKVLRREYADDPDFRERFTTEARNAASLHHPGIASVFDFGELGDGVPFLVMELVEGRPLSDLIRGQALAPDAVRAIVQQTADALAVAHRAGIVHRDVKPANLLVTPAGEVKITDFGIARAADGLALTQTGQLVGTPQYLSPEQVDGQSATPASDVYALGVVLYECLTGGRPFTGETPVATALAHLRQPIPELPADVPADLRAVCERALAKDPAERYADAGELAAALRGDEQAGATQLLSAAGPADVPETGRNDAPVPRWRRLPWPVAAVGVLAVLLLVSLFLFRGSGDQSNRTPARASTGTTPSPSTATRTVPLRAFVGPNRYLGMSYTAATDALHSLGFRHFARLTTANSGTHVAGTVEAVSPTGLVARSRTITLTVWGSPPAPPPAPAPKPAPHHHGGGKHKKHGKGRHR